MSTPTYSYKIIKLALLTGTNAAHFRIFVHSVFHSNIDCCIECIIFVNFLESLMVCSVVSAKGITQYCWFFTIENLFFYLKVEGWHRYMFEATVAAKDPLWTSADGCSVLSQWGLVLLTALLLVYPNPKTDSSENRKIIFIFDFFAILYVRLCSNCADETVLYVRRYWYAYNLFWHVTGNWRVNLREFSQASNKNDHFS